MNPSPDSRPPGNTARLIALAVLFLGALTALAGLAFTAFFACIVWRQVDSTPYDSDARGTSNMVSFFDSANHMAGISLGAAMAGLVVVIASMLALSRTRKATKTGN